MKFKRLIGFLFIISAVAGFIFSAIGLYEVWRYRPLLTQTVTETLALYDQALSATQDGLTSLDQMMQITTLDVASLQSATKSLSQTMLDSTAMMDSLTSLTGKNLPDSIDATQTSLASAQSSALLIDNALAAITSIPFLPVTVYKPDVPLHTALAQVSDSLNSIKPALVTITSSLKDGKTGLSGVVVEINSISESMNGISAALSNAQAVLDRYQTITAQLKTRVEAAQLAAADGITLFTWVVSFFLGWLLVTQLGLGLQGLDMLRGHAEVKK